MCPPDFAVLTGNGTVLLNALRAGATGAILAVGCVVPEVCVEIFRALNAGDDEHAALLQENLTPLAAAVTTRFGIGGLKFAMDQVGYHGGAVRAPLRAADEAARREIAALLEEVHRSGRLSV
jgi:4-hydroxy-2-oxoglutarate aldolase